MCQRYDLERILEKRLQYICKLAVSFALPNISSRVKLTPCCEFACKCLETPECSEDACFLSLVIRFRVVWPTYKSYHTNIPSFHGSQYASTTSV